MSLSEERTCRRPAVELGHEIDWRTATQRRQRLQPNVKDEATSAGFLPLLGLPVAGGVVCYPAAEQVDYANCIDPRVARSDCSFSFYLFFLTPHPHPPPPPPYRKTHQKTHALLLLLLVVVLLLLLLLLLPLWRGGGSLLLF